MESQNTNPNVRIYQTKKKLLIIALVAVALLVIAGIFSDGDDVPTSVDSTSQTTQFHFQDFLDSNSTTTTTESTTVQDEQGYRYNDIYTGVRNTEEFYYNHLSPDQKAFYRIIYDGLKEGKESVYINNAIENGVWDKISTTIIAFTNDHPEYFWIRGGYKESSYTVNGDGTLNITLNLQFYDFYKSIYNLDEYKSKLNLEVNKISALASYYETDYEKALFVHNYLIEIADYDHESFKLIQKGNYAPNIDYVYTPYGCLINKNTVCAGYAKAYQLILNNLGIDCTYVEGTANNGSHAWNLLTLDGEDYYVDVTWDDLSSSSGFTDQKYAKYWPEPQYTYFAITTNQLYKTHTIDKTNFYFYNCNATKYDYFIYNNYYVQYYNEYDIKQMITSQNNQKLVSIRFANPADLKKACENINSLTKGTGIPEQFTYIENTETNTLIILN